MTDNRLRDKVGSLIYLYSIEVGLLTENSTDLEARIIALVNEEKSLSYGIGYQDGQRKRSRI